MMTQKKEGLPVVSEMDDYLKKGYNVLLPSQTIKQVSDMHEPALEVVNLAVNSGDAYGNDHYDLTKAKEFCLSKQGLMKLAHCAGISWDWNNTKRIDPMTDRNYIAYQALGALQRSDGRWIPLKASYEIDLEVVEEELRRLYTKKAKDIRNLNSDESREFYIEESVKRELLRKRKHKLRLAETGAMNAVIRALLALKSVYTRAELTKPFVVPRIIFKPDMDDPAIRRAIVVTGIKAIQQVYGSGPIPYNPQYAGDPIEVPPIQNGDHVEDNGSETEALPAPSDKKGKGKGKKKDEKSEQTETVDEPPFAEPVGSSETAEKAALTIVTLDDFKKMDENRAPTAIRMLMKRKNYSENLLKEKNIDKWKREHQEAFVKLLLEKMPDATESGEQG